MRRIITAAAVLAAATVLATACGMATDGTDANGRSAAGANTTHQPAASKPPAAAETKAGPKTFAMGYRATITDDDSPVLHLTIDKPRTVTDQYIDAQQGRFLAVTVTFEAIAAAQDINEFDLVAVTAGGERIQPTFGPDAGTALNSATLNTGEKAKGAVIFDVPKTGVVGIAYAPGGQILGTWKL